MNPDRELEPRLRAYAARLDAAAADAGPVVAATGRVASDRRRRTWLAGTAVAASLAAIAAIAYLAGTGDDGRRVTGGVIAGSPASTDASGAVAPDTTAPAPTTTTAPPVAADVVFPDLAGDESTQAWIQMHQLGLTNVAVVAEASDVVGAGLVLRTIPEPRARLARTDLVTLVISTGPADSGLTLDSAGRVVRDLLPTDAVPTAPLPGDLSERVIDDRYLGRLAGTTFLVRRVEVADPSGGQPSICVFFESTDPAAPGDAPGGGCGPAMESGDWSVRNLPGGGALALTPGDGATMVALEDGVRMELTHPVDGLAVFLVPGSPTDGQPLTACWFDESGRVLRTKDIPD